MGTNYRSNQPYRSLRTYSGQGGGPVTVDLSVKANILARVKSDCMKTYDEFGYSYDEPNYPYDPVCLGLLTEFVSFRASIRKITAANLDIQARLSKIGQFTLTAQARVSQYHKTEVSGQARMQQTRVAGVDSLALIRPAGHFRAQARLSQLRLFTLAGQARISQYHKTGFAAKSRLIHMSQISLASRIRNVYKPKLQIHGRVSRKGQRWTWIRGRIWPYSRLKARARIKDVSWKRRYINSLTKPLAQGTIPGRGAILIHTNGNAYCVYSDAYLNGVCERRLWLSISTDGGVTWGNRIQLSSGGWDNEPSLLQLDETSTTSDIGIAFVRGWARNIYRLIFSVNGTVVMAPQPIMYGSYNTNDAHTPNLVKLANGKYRIWYIDPALGKSLYYSDSPSTSYAGTTQWTSATYKYPGGQSSSASPYITSLSIRKHKDSGHLIGLLVYVERKDGRDSPIYYAEANLTYSLGYICSSDDGANWTSIQPLVTSQATPYLTLAQKLCPISADFTELKDGSLGILYQEGDVHQVIDYYTRVQQGVNYLRSVGVIYDDLRDTLIYAEKYVIPYDDITTQGGLFFAKRNAQGELEPAFTITCRTTPPLWSHAGNALRLSPNKRFLLYPSDWGISVLDMQDEDHTKWTFREYRKSTVSAMKGDNIQWAEWVDDDRIAFGYGLGVGGSIWGGAFNMSDPDGTYVHLYSQNNFGSPAVAYNGRVVVKNNIAFFIYSYNLVATSLITGQYLGTYYLSNMLSDTLVYDARNDEFIIASNIGVYFLKFNWNTYAFTQLRSLLVASGSNPKLYQIGGCYFNCGDNILMPAGGASDYTLQVYNTVRKEFIGAIHAGDIALGFGIYPGDNRYYPSDVINVKGKKWLVYAGADAGIWFMPIDNLGKLRYGVFVYDQNAKKIYEGDANFYDIESPRTISPEDYASVEFPKLTSREDGALLIYSRYATPSKGSQPFAPIITLGWTDGMTVSAKARLIPATSLLTRGRISVGSSTNLSMRVRMIAGGNLKTVARIQQTYAGTITGQARILNMYAPSFDVKALVRANHPLSALARVSRSGIYGLTAQGRVLKHLNRSMALRGRLVRLTDVSARAFLIPKRSLDVRGRISHFHTNTISAKAHIHILGRPTFSAFANIRKGLEQTFSAKALMMHGSAPEMKARVSQRQGWPEPAGYDYQWLVFTQTALRMRGRIGEAITYQMDTGLRARIYPVKFTDVAAKAKLVTGQVVQMRAKISPWRSYVYLPCQYAVQKVEKKRVRMVFYRQGSYNVPLLGMKTKISQKTSKRFTGHFIVPLTRMEENVISIETSQNLHFGQRFTAKAFIVRS